MNELILGMAIQAFVNAALVSTGAINPVAGQQAICGVLLLVAAIVLRK